MHHPYCRSCLLLEVLVWPSGLGVTHVSVSSGRRPGTQQGKERRDAVAVRRAGVPFHPAVRSRVVGGSQSAHTCLPA